MRNRSQPLRARGGIALLALGAALAVGCGSSTESACNGTVRFTVSPADTTIAVGQSYLAQTTILSCGGTRTIQDALTMSRP